MTEYKQGLRALADARGFKIGAAVDMKPIADEPAYDQALTREFNMCVGENAFKPAFVWKGPRDYWFEDTDRLAEFARQNGMLLRGHTLLWHQSVPKWLAEGEYKPADARDLLSAYIHAIVSRYRGQIEVWDVVNEAVADGEEGGMREASFWYKTLGPEYIDLAFHWAHEADPDARLYYNDYEAEGMNAKANAIYALARDMQARSIPIHGIGLQCHLINGWRVTDENRANIRRIAALGLDWQVTECDIRMQLDGKEPTTEQLQVQAEGYADLIRLCVDEPGCQGFLVWGFTDAHSWIPGFRKGWGAPLPLDEHYQPKPAYHAIAQALSK
ncbi:MAG TPA: endo-1,4-beta-xylanase [Capsulimonadaceae bacterium]|nr:endo-1,4-beta-xylanase [Capsulimonadaceae bacterium]